MACRLPGRTYVLGGAHDLSQLSDGAEPSGQPEVHDLNVPRRRQGRQQDVLRLKQEENDASDRRKLHYTPQHPLYISFPVLDPKLSFSPITLPVYTF